MDSIKIDANCKSIVELKQLISLLWILSNRHKTNYQIIYNDLTINLSNYKNKDDFFNFLWTIR